ncbi:type II secretion system protein GspC [Kangiella sp. TOML190]|uniref:type II secretion system protein GspC n=1 Tax=Kangiella sp. TOML190 TaxID=2931351 RepID=UPI00204211B4|nr:type II secretion system protein GspC [Kangiella sp. TOML190]
MNTSSQKISAMWQKHMGLIGKLIALVFILLALYWLAKMVWLWVDYAQPKPVASNVIEAPKVRKSTPVNANNLVKKHLFGIANQKPVEVEEVVGETRLNLKLLGVYVGADDKAGSAIIRAGGGKEKVYWIDDKLEVSGRGNVTLKRVEPLKVIINNNGKNETLTLLEQLNKQVMATANKKQASADDKDADAKTIDKRRDSRISKQLADMKEKLVSSPQSYADLARFEPVVDANGQVSGFKLAPGKDPRMFTRLGLRRNDVVKSINGVGLDNQAYWAALEQLQTSDTLEINLERNGQAITLLLNVGANSAETTPENRQQEPRRTSNSLEIQ